MTEQLGLFDARGARELAAIASTPLRVRQSRRARRLTLRLLPPHTLELVVPRGTQAAEVAAFVHAHRRWIERARRDLATCQPVRSEGLPERIELASIGVSFSVQYVHEPKLPPRYRLAGTTLEVRTREADRGGAEALLRGWLLDQADYHLTPWLLRESAVVGRRPANVQVRLQRSRWGSCSNSGTVSLNAALLFVAPEVVRYLLIHELCHFLSMNHSRKFWRAVARHEPNYAALDRRLTAAWTDIPLWAHAQVRSR